MATANPYTFLRESIDPIVSRYSADLNPFDDPLLSILNKEFLEGMETDEAGILDLYQWVSSPCVVIGDRFAYKTGERDLKTGKIKFKKLTIQVKVTEDEMNRMLQRGSAGLITSSIRTDMINNANYLKTNIMKLLINAWEGATTSTDYDSLFNSLFQSSSSGTISNPSDLCATAGTPDDISASCNLSGTAQTANAVAMITNYVFTAFTKIDYITKVELPYSKIYMGCHPLVYAILNSTRDLLNSTTGQLDDKSMLKALEAEGITVFKNVYFDSDYAKTSGTTSQLTFFADPLFNFSLLTIPPAEGIGWSEWSKEGNTEGDITTYSYEKHKKLEFAVRSQPYWIMTSATAGYMFKPVYIMTVTPYENS